MNRRQFQTASEQARKRAVELGEAGDTAAVPELMALCGHAGPTVRRAAASALGKLATDGAARTEVAGVTVKVVSEEVLQKRHKDSER
jgi:HEAT repeat protein